MRALLEDLVTPFDSALARVWLVGPGDQCASCPMRPECPDRSRCLHLAVSVGLSSRLDGPFRRFPIGAREVGRVVLERAPYVARAGLEGRRLADPAWLALHGIRSFAAVPLELGAECTGVLAVFSRRVLTEGDVRGLGAAARLLALALATDLPIAGRATGGTLAEIEREAIERTLAATRGRVSGPEGAARILGLKPTTLHSRMKKLGVRRPRAAP